VLAASPSPVLILQILVCAGVTAAENLLWLWNGTAKTGIMASRDPVACSVLAALKTTLV
jgi:hypothetical protein